jgi:hypothetical protein
MYASHRYHTVRLRVIDDHARRTGDGARPHRIQARAAYRAFAGRYRRCYILLPFLTWIAATFAKQLFDTVFMEKVIKAILGVLG